MNRRIITRGRGGGVVYCTATNHGSDRRTGFILGQSGQNLAGIPVPKCLLPNSTPRISVSRSHLDSGFKIEQSRSGSNVGVGTAWDIHLLSESKSISPPSVEHRKPEDKWEIDEEFTS